MVGFKKILILVLLGVVFLALFFVLAGKDKTFGRKFLYQEQGSGIYQAEDGKFYLGGDLFGFSEVERFKEKINNTQLKKGEAIDKADISLKGDSFFNTGYDSEPVPNALQHKTEKKIFYLPTSGREITPLQYLAEINYQPAGEKLFIIETIERNSVERFNGLKKDFINENSVKATAENNNRLSVLKAKIKSIAFDRVGVEYFIKNNFVFKPINAWFKNKAFSWLGDIDSKTPIYSNNPNLLFFDAELKFNEDRAKLDAIDELADNITLEAKLVKARYNLVLVYLIIPNKLSIYDDVVIGAKKYDEFIPKLQAALADRGVRYINIYDLYKNYRLEYPGDLLYYAGDTHYSPKGKELLINQVLEDIQDYYQNGNNAQESKDNQATK